MPVHNTLAYWVTCDECDWVSEYCDWHSQAEDLLDKHIEEDH